MPGVGVLERGAEVFVTGLARALRDDHGVEVELYCRGATDLPHHRIRAIPGMFRCRSTGSPFQRPSRWR